MALLLANLLVLGFLYKILSRKPLFTYIREKHGTETLRQCRTFEKTVLKYEKTLYDLRFLLKCKKEGLIPTFAQPKVSIEGGARLRKRIADLIIKTELKTKHKTRNELKKEVERLSVSIRESMSFLLYNTVRYKVRMVVSTRRRKWTTTHNKKLEALRSEAQPTVTSTTSSKAVAQNVIHNFSSYSLSESEHRVLSP